MLPVSIITGFLGSGKTTLLNRMLSNASLKGSLVIINEFGEIGIDHLLVSAPSENVRLLSNGCLCCEVRGDLVETLTDVTRKRINNEIFSFDRILIETTGLADPVPLIRTIVTDPALSQLYFLDKVITVVDTVHAVSQIAMQDEVRKQISMADILLLSKTDLVNSDLALEVKDSLEVLNPGADQINVINGEIEHGLLFEQNSPNSQRRKVNIDRWISFREKPSSSVNPRTISHTADIKTFTISFAEPVSGNGLATWLNMLASFKGPQLLRVKGIVNVNGAPYVIHAVQTVIHDPVLLDAWPTPDKITRIVFIVRDLDRETIESTFSAIKIPMIETQKAQFIDPVAYKRFAEVAKRFI